jgi:hypothetical protein
LRTQDAAPSQNGNEHEGVSSNSAQDCLDLLHMNEDNSVDPWQGGSSVLETSTTTSACSTELFPRPATLPSEADGLPPLLQFDWEQFDANQSLDFLGQSSDVNDQIHRLMDMSFLSCVGATTHSDQLSTSFFSPSDRSSPSNLWTESFDTH